MITNLKCSKHNLKFIGICTSEICSQNRFYCHDCLFEQTYFGGLIEIEKFQADFEGKKKQLQFIQNEILNNLDIFRNNLEKIDFNSINILILLNDIKPFNDMVMLLEELKVYSSQIKKVIKSTTESLQQKEYFINQKTYHQNNFSSNIAYSTQLQSKMQEEYQNQEIKEKKFRTEKTTVDMTTQTSESQVEPNDSKIQNKSQEHDSLLNNNRIVQNKEVVTYGNQLQYSLTLKNFQLCFSNTLKALTIYLKENETIAFGDQFALCKQTIPKNSRVQFAFSPIKGEYIFIGVCDRTIVEKNKYKTSFTKNNFNHGTYLISSNGYSFSSLEENFNCEETYLEFNQNDIVIVQLDNQLKRIQWFIIKKSDFKEESSLMYNKMNAKNSFSLNIDSSIELTPCVYVKYNSSVEILNNYTRYF